MGLGAFGPRNHLVILDFMRDLCHPDSQAGVRSRQARLRFGQGLAEPAGLSQMLLG
jgi:hypothetical protein